MEKDEGEIWIIYLVGYMVVINRIKCQGFQGKGIFFIKEENCQKIEGVRKSQVPSSTLEDLV